MTNADKIRTMPTDEIANWIPCPYLLDKKKSMRCDYFKVPCKDCKKEWLNQPCDKIPKPVIPEGIDTDKFTREIISSTYFFDGAVSKMEFLASKINEIIGYLEKRDK